ncbi:anaerobic glycerol-3-phosphate dehydrogenase subunit C [Pelagibaculum spongiae]|uniref:Anaerobic glycerol-3-phosphate dehydrogenase subunit C n=2 Tax=Pelagibaculum spongiae TaxID=2080658 RepID=A0A2V1H140_9GAMM|nr:anaerobic glycerol-3-phosphate dehydrogenase subunit C [Pelagibaculum spongiae]
MAALSKSSLDGSFEKCIKCTVCTVYCPVAKANPNYPGPKQSGPDGERVRRKDPALFDDYLKLCTNCKRCEIACPSGVNIGDIIAQAKLTNTEGGWKNSGAISPKRVRDYILSSTDLMGGMVANPLAKIVNKVVALKPIKVVMEKTIGVSAQRTFPKYAEQSFVSWYKKQEATQNQFERQVHYFHGCSVNYNMPELGHALVEVLNKMNIGVQIAKKAKCCGVPLVANGFKDKAMKNATANIEVYKDELERQPGTIIATSSSCSYMLSDEYDHVLGLDNEPFKKNLQFFSRYLINEFDAGNMPKLKPLNLTLAYHTPCHLERSGGVIYTLELLSRIPGINLIRLDPNCCGIAGTYGFKEENYETSQKIGSPVFKQIEESGCDYVITDCETCRWQVEMSTTKEVLHPIELLARALA